MAQWNHTLDIVDAWKKADNDEISIHEFATQVLVKFRSLSLGKNYESTKAEIIDRLESFVEDPTADKDDFDDVLDELHDFADDVRIWIKKVN